MSPPSTIAQAVEKLQKRCVVKFKEDVIQIICSGDMAEAGGIQVWSSIKISSLFSDYRIQSNAGNEITVSLSTEALLATLRSAAGPSSSQSSSTSFTSDTVIIMKLAKKNNQAVLSFEISGTTAQGRAMHITHDVRIDIMKPQDVARLREPDCPNPDVHIFLPPLSKLRTVIERLRPLAADILAVRANRAGALQLSASTDNARVDVAWAGLENPKFTQDGSSQASQSDEEPRDPAQMSGVLVSLRSLAKFVSSHVVSPTTLAGICQNHCIILYVYIGEITDAGGVLTFYIPAVFDN